MRIQLLIKMSILFCWLVFFTNRLEASEPGNKALYHADIKLGKVHLIGYLSILNVADTGHRDQGNPDHHCQADSMGMYHRVVFGSRGGNMFFDLIFRNDTVTPAYLTPSLQKDGVMEKVEDLLKELIDTLEAQHPAKPRSLSEEALNLSVSFTPLSDPKQR